MQCLIIYMRQPGGRGEQNMKRLGATEHGNDLSPRPSFRFKKENLQLISLHCKDRPPVHRRNAAKHVCEARRRDPYEKHVFFQRSLRENKTLQMAYFQHIAKEIDACLECKNFSAQRENVFEMCQKC